MENRAVFPERGAITTVKLIDSEDLVQGPEESDLAWKAREPWAKGLAPIEIDVELVEREKLVELSHEYLLADADEDRRKANLERDGKVVPPSTLDGLKEQRRLNKKAIVLLVRSIRRLTVGHRHSEELDGEELAKLVDDAGLLPDVARRARAAQSPTPQQLER